MMLYSYRSWYPNSPTCYTQYCWLHSLVLLATSSFVGISRLLSPITIMMISIKVVISIVSIIATVLGIFPLLLYPIKNQRFHAHLHSAAFSSRLRPCPEKELLERRTYESSAKMEARNLQEDRRKCQDERQKLHEQYQHVSHTGITHF